MNDNFAKAELLKMAEKLHIKEWSKRLGIKQDLVKKVWQFYKAKIIEKKDIITNMSVCIYLVCRKYQMPFTLYEVSMASGVPSRFIHKKYRAVARATGMRIVSPRIWDYIPRFCLIIDKKMDDKTIKKAVKISKWAQKHCPQILTCSPIGIASACIYLATDDEIIQRFIADKIGVTDNTIRKISREIKFASGKDLEELMAGMAKKRRRKNETR